MRTNGNLEKLSSLPTAFAGSAALVFRLSGRIVSVVQSADVHQGIESTLPGCKNIDRKCIHWLKITSVWGQ